MSNDNKKVAEVLSVMVTPENIEKYILGTKKNGTPRAVYDIVKDYTQPKKKKKKKKHKDAEITPSYAFYLSASGGKKKKKKKKKKNKDHWHI